MSRPPKTMSGGTKPVSGFLFIDFEADTSNDPEVTRQKHTFIQRNFHQKLKQTRLEKLKASKPRIGWIFQPVKGPVLEPPQADDAIKVEPDRDPVQQANLLPEAWTVNQYLDASFVDPFSSPVLPMTDAMNLYWRHFRLHTITSSYPFDTARMGMWWWQKAITEPALLQALLFLSAGHKAALESNSGVSSMAVRKSFKDSFRLRGGALCNLKYILQDPVMAVAESNTLIVAFLLAIEGVDANAKAVEAHLKGLKRLIQLQGGIDALDHMTVSEIYQADVRCASFKCCRPHFRMSTKWRSEVISDKKIFRSRDDVNIPGQLPLLATRFSTTNWSSDLDLPTHCLIFGFQRLVRYYEAARLQPSMVVPTDNDLFVIFEHQLLSVCFDPATASTTTGLISECVRLSLFLYSNIRIRDFQAFPFIGCIVAYLRQMLEMCFADMLLASVDLLFWICFIAGMGAKGYHDHSWFVAQLADIAHLLGLHDLSQVNGLLIQFFWTVRVNETSQRELWEEVLLEQRGKSRPQIMNIKTSCESA
ncbi:conserved hypothetical protein [Talaromyces stipitatus ATCC 10500]|uniref:Uncharacterized protein n=1 Tax=Talaromyces stipitatus (strain ATCC 10500 / CBS 375.48 / QM 6759 / NRRL 1006) TaxID=441959 RepID=B8M5S9_TALSN|nr:uncharacterized protein TSTA_033050 [Talaromyces stipitatus ATCC 10500]EED20056.1 conserved hypothetical protein [Talaromyces stipitatus ATCC 10500]